MTTHCGAEDNRSVFRHSPGGRKSKIKASARPRSRRGSRAGAAVSTPAAGAPGRAWLVDTSPRSLHSTPSSRDLLWVSGSESPFSVLTRTLVIGFRLFNQSSVNALGGILSGGDHRQRCDSKHTRRRALTSVSEQIPALSVSFTCL